MVKRDSRSEVRLTADMDTLERSHRPEGRGDAQPFVIAVLGDFRGVGEDTATKQAADRRLLQIDRDNFDTVMQRLNPRWEGRLRGTAGEGEGQVLRLAFRALDDFHPDRIAARLDPFLALLDTRRRLLEPSGFGAAAAEVSQWAKAEATPPTQVPPAADASAEAPSSGLLDRILEGAESSAHPTLRTPAAGDLQRLVERIVAPHLIRVDTHRQAELVAAVDAAIAELMRAILHDPRFQQLEAAWRSLWRLVSAVESDVALKIRILQCTKEELQQDLTRDDIRTSATVRLLVEAASAPGSQRPALLIGNYEFAHGADDVQLLGCLGAIAEQLGAPFVAAAAPQLLGCASFTELPSAMDLASRFQRPEYETWRGLRRLPPARWLALTLPRLLCRLPYGAETDPVETFSFEECAAAPRHDHLLWGNGAFALAVVAASAFAADGWSLDISNQVQRLEGLPLFVYDDDGTTVTKPCAEVLLNERILEALEELGMLPLVSYRDTDVVVLPCIQSLATARAPLRVARSATS